jgi:hypothetical protein
MAERETTVEMPASVDTRAGTADADRRVRGIEDGLLSGGMVSNLLT